MRSRNKVSSVVEVNNPSTFWQRSSAISETLLGRRVNVYNGRKFVSLLIRKEMVGFRFGEFIVTKALGSTIHVVKRKK
jgi:ribosomal protein S19